MYSVLGDETVEGSREDIADDPENAHLISTQTVERKEGNGKYYGRRGIFHWIVHATTISVLVAVLFREKSSRSLASTSLYSPAREISGISSAIRTFDGSFWQRTPYKGPPTDKVVSAWRGITVTPALNITAEEMSKMGKSLDSVQYPEDIGGGYLAYSEAAHQLHCLESLWEDHHYNRFPEYFPILTHKRAQLPEIMEHHYEHCVDIIRQQLMCIADPGLVTFRWVEGIHGPYPDFETNHMCRDYDTLLEWGESRAANDLFKDEWIMPKSGIVKLSHDWASHGSDEEVSFGD